MKTRSQMEKIRSIRKHPLLLRHYEMNDDAAALLDSKFKRTLRETAGAPRNNT